MHRRLMALFLTSIFILGASATLAAPLCQNVFSSPSVLDKAIAKAESKALKPNGEIRGLSPKDLEYVVRRIFNKELGARYRVSAYWKLTTEQRTYRALERQMGEKLVQNGALKYLQERGLVIEKSKLLTRLRQIIESRIVNSLSVTHVLLSSLNGIPPIVFPKLQKSKLSSEDLSLLLLEGLDSPVGKSILAKYKFDQEFDRAYAISTRYYTRAAIVIVAYLIFNKTMDQLSEEDRQESEAAFTRLMSELNKMSLDDSEPQTAEDILFETVLQNFFERFQRVPTKTEQLEICRQVYSHGQCH